MKKNDFFSLKPFFVTLLLFAAISVSAQYTNYTDFYQQSMKTNNTGMFVLGGWAIANIATGGIGWAKNSGSLKYFNQMNLFWNTVNLSIAGFALYSNYQQEILKLSEEGMLQNHLKVENLYLINGGLDVVYIGTGFLLKHLSTKNEKRKHLLHGYGNSIILQGAFLFVFDLVMWGIQRNHRLEFLNNLEPVLTSAEFTEIGFKLCF